MRDPYTAQEVKDAIEKDRERLFAPWALGRPEGWACDSRTRDLVCIGYWLDEQMMSMGLDDRGRIVLLGFYNRRGRSEEDLFALGAELMNDALKDNIDRDRRPHRRWG